MVIHNEPSSDSRPPNDLQPIPHQRQPDGVLHAVVVVREGAAGVVRRIDEDALHLARELLLQRLERQQVVAEDQPIVEDVVLA